MLDPVYCVSCRKQIDPTWANCPHCGASQTAGAKAPPQSSPLPVAPIYALPQAVNPQVVLNECTKQYRNLNWISFAGIFLLSAYFIGLAMIIYAMVQKPALRRRVSELGIDPEPWEKPLRAEFGRIMLWGVAGCLGLAILSTLFCVLFLMPHPSTQ